MVYKEYLSRILRWTPFDDDDGQAYDPVEFLNIRPIVADEYERRLLHAVRCNDATGVRSALGSGYVSPDVIFSSGSSLARNEPLICDEFELDTNPLYLAAQLGHLPCLVALIEHGADVNGTVDSDFLNWKDKRQPIHAAAKHGHVSCLIELLVRGAEVDEPEPRTWLGHMADLHLAARHGHVECVAVLLKYTAELRKTSAERMSLVDAEGKTPLHLAAEHGHRGCIRELLRCGASTDVTDQCGNTPFELAAMNGHAEAWDVSYQLEMHQFIAKRRKTSLTTKLQDCFLKV
jgi:ankyrin repeat protein